MSTTYLLDRIDKKNSQALAGYRRDGGYETARKVLQEGRPDAVTDQVKASGLRGRGGAGFPTGVKWAFMPKEPDPKRPSYLAVNADESEPGTCKDRVLMEQDPHLLLEGILISSFAIRASRCYIFVRGEYTRSIRVLQEAITEATEAGLFGKDIFGTGYDLDLVVHSGAGAYICGEETALMESLEGKRGHPRPKPPFPAGFGIWGNPTTVNNVETICNVPAIMARGADWYRSMGTEQSPGNALFSVSGHVERPQVLERPLGITVGALIGECGGIWQGRKLKAFIPGGSSTGFLPADLVDLPLEHQAVAEAGAMLGCGSLIVMDETTDMVRAATTIAEFYADESCGQCSQCREGTGWMMKILHRIQAGKGRPQDLELLISLCDGAEGKTICPFTDATAFPLRSALKYFRDDFEAAVSAGEGS